MFGLPVVDTDQLIRWTATGVAVDAEPWQAHQI